MPVGDASVAVTLRARDDASRSLQRLREEGRKTGDSLRSSFSAARAAAIGLAGVGFVLVRSFGRVAGELDKLGKLADVIDFSSEGLSTLSHQAGLMGVAFTDIGVAMRTLAIRVGQAKQGNEQFAQGLRDAGVDISTLSGKSGELEQIYLRIADRIASLKDRTAQAAIANRVFGESGTKLIEVLEQGSEGYRNMADDAGRLGAIYSREEIARFEEYNDSIARLGTAWKSAVVALTPLVNVITGILNNLASFVGSLRGSNRTPEDNYVNLRAIELGIHAQRGGVIPEEYYEQARSEYRALQAEIAANQPNTFGQGPIPLSGVVAQATEVVREVHRMRTVVLEAPSGLEGIIAGIREVGAALGNAYETSRGLTRDFLTGLGSDWERLFFDRMRNGFVSLKSFLLDFFDTILQQLQRLVARILSDQLLSILVGSLGSIFGGFLGSSGGIGTERYPGGSTPILPGTTSTPNPYAPPIGLPAGGGDSGGGTTVNIYAMDAQSFSSFAEQHGSALASAVASATSKSPRLRGAITGSLR